MKKVSEYIKSLGFTFSFRRLKRAIVLVILFVLIGSIVFIGLKYKNSKAWIESVYKREVLKTYDVGEKVIIEILKDDVVNNGRQDYVYIIGKEIKDEDNSVASSYVELYEDVELIILDGTTNETIVYETSKDFSSDVELKVYEDELNKYYMVADTSGNIVLCKLDTDEVQDVNSPKLINVVSNTTSEFLGYTIYTQKVEDSKLKVTLDNYNKDYLHDYNEETILDFSENGIDISRYRETYLRDKFSGFELKDTNNDGILEFVGYQYLLYSLDDLESKTLGIVKTIFTINTKEKLEFSHVEISII